MNQKIKRRWVEALRSGEYKQTVGGLQRERGHCCLGVLCEVVDKLSPGAAVRVKSGFLEGWTLASQPQVVMKARLGDMRIDQLLRMNDSGVPFSTIANLIEETF